MAAASRVLPPWSPLYASQIRTTSIRVLVSPLRLAVGAAIRSPGRLAAAVNRAGCAFDPCLSRAAFLRHPLPDTSSAQRSPQRKAPEGCVR
jgi:hypothetical protein